MQNDLQAMARCHRIGQDKDVTVYRLITDNTYEQNVFECSTRKQGAQSVDFQSAPADIPDSTQLLSSLPSLACFQIRFQVQQRSRALLKTSGTVSECDCAQSRQCHRSCIGAFSCGMVMLPIHPVAAGRCHSWHACMRRAGQCHPGLPER